MSAPPIAKHIGWQGGVCKGTFCLPSFQKFLVISVSRRVLLYMKILKIIEEYTDAFGPDISVEDYMLYLRRAQEKDAKYGPAIIATTICRLFRSITVLNAVYH